MQVANYHRGRRTKILIGSGQTKPIPVKTDGIG
jgi:hypothetical protein